MARVLGALLSESAWGKFGRLLVFRRGVNYGSVLVMREPRKTRTPKQIIIRKIYGLIQADYRIMSEEMTKEYRVKAYGKQMSGHNIFYQEVFPWIYESICGDSHCGFGTCVE